MKKEKEAISTTVTALLYLIMIIVELAITVSITFGVFLGIEYLVTGKWAPQNIIIIGIYITAWAIITFVWLKLMLSFIKERKKYVKAVKEELTKSLNS